MVAYNLLNLFRHQALNEGKTSILKTLKSQCFAIGALERETRPNSSTQAIPALQKTSLDGLNVATNRRSFSFISIF